MPISISLTNEIFTLSTSYFGVPAVNMLPTVLKSTLKLTDRNIFWAPERSAGIQLSLPIETCCSVSLVLAQHAQVCSKHQLSLQYTELDSHIQFLQQVQILTYCTWYWDHLQGTPLHIIQWFQHNIDTGSASPRYKLSYCQNFAPYVMKFNACKL